ncbi:hypothetical protein SAMN05444143_103224 [Flavobacterium succinicans]|uniref:Uncharacterized protein n=1 Tax=Flavobacterium succinicans TaxID=29536 RepID=A0A1I4ULJ1_9FLAO|nr:hypothetical protein SAMN05444143_103224 [Flavobacterium succinicans]
MLKGRETFIIFTVNNLIKNGAKSETFAQHTLIVFNLRGASLNLQLTYFIFCRFFSLKIRFYRKKNNNEIAIDFNFIPFLFNHNYNQIL